LRALITKTGRKPYELLRSKEGVTAETPDEEIISMMVRDPNLLQRPIVEVGDKAVVARPIEKALELVGK
jgi:arsenate reductase (glutaredoxin)